MSDWPEEGDKAPQFTLAANDGSKWKLSEAKGKTVVIYFYPKDDTPGCTKEACAFRDQQQKFKKQGVQIVGISPDSQEAHEKFRKKYKLNFPLLWINNAGILSPSLPRLPVVDVKRNAFV